MNTENMLKKMLKNDDFCEVKNKRLEGDGINKGDLVYVVGTHLVQ